VSGRKSATAGSCCLVLCIRYRYITDGCIAVCGTW
jgi:hypothetical protein